MSGIHGPRRRPLQGRLLLPRRGGLVQLRLRARPTAARGAILRCAVGHPQQLRRARNGRGRGRTYAVHRGLLVRSSSGRFDARRSRRRGLGHPELTLEQLHVHVERLDLHPKRCCLHLCLRRALLQRRGGLARLAWHRGEVGISPAVEHITYIWRGFGKSRRSPFGQRASAHVHVHAHILASPRAVTARCCARPTRHSWRSPVLRTASKINVNRVYPKTPLS